MRARPASPIPLFGRKPVNPFAPIGISAAIARCVGQEPAPDLIRGGPQAGAGALPLTEVSTVARSRPVGGGARARGLIMTAIVLAMTGGSISAASAVSVKTQSAPMAATNPVSSMTLVKVIAAQIVGPTLPRTHLQFPRYWSE